MAYGLRSGGPPPAHMPAQPNRRVRPAPHGLQQNAHATQEQPVPQPPLEQPPPQPIPNPPNPIEAPFYAQIHNVLGNLNHEQLSALSDAAASLANTRQQLPRPLAPLAPLAQPAQLAQQDAQQDAHQPTELHAQVAQAQQNNINPSAQHNLTQAGPSRIETLPNTTVPQVNTHQLNNNQHIINEIQPNNETQTNQPNINQPIVHTHTNLAEPGNVQMHNNKLTIGLDGTNHIEFDASDTTRLFNVNLVNPAGRQEIEPRDLANLLKQAHMDLALRFMHTSGMHSAYQRLFAAAVAAQRVPHDFDPRPVPPPAPAPAPPPPMQYHMEHMQSNHTSRHVSPMAHMAVMPFMGPASGQRGGAHFNEDHAGPSHYNQAPKVFPHDRSAYIKAITPAPLQVDFIQDDNHNIIGCKQKHTLSTIRAFMVTVRTYCTFLNLPPAYCSSIFSGTAAGHMIQIVGQHLPHDSPTHSDAQWEACVKALYSCITHQLPVDAPHAVRQLLHRGRVKQRGKCMEEYICSFNHTITEGDLSEHEKVHWFLSGMDAHYRDMCSTDMHGNHWTLLGDVQRFALGKAPSKYAMQRDNTPRHMHINTQHGAQHGPHRRHMHGNNRYSPYPPPPNTTTPRPQYTPNNYAPRPTMALIQGDNTRQGNFATYSQHTEATRGTVNALPEAQLVGKVYMRQPYQLGEKISRTHFLALNGYCGQCKQHMGRQTYNDHTKQCPANKTQHKANK